MFFVPKFGRGGLMGLGEQVGETGAYESAGNPCGAGYSWNADDESCTPTQDRVDAATATLNWLRNLGVKTPAPKGTSGQSSLEQYLPIIAVGGAAILLIGMMRRR